MDEKTRTALTARYLGTMPEKLSDLRTLLAELLAGSEGATKRTRDAAHKLVGSGAAYGFPEITVAARAVEQASIVLQPECLRELISTIVKAHERGRSRTTRILIVDDDTELAELLRQLLRPLASEVHIAASASAGEALLAQQTYDLLILDLVLPDGDGRALLRKIRASTEHSGLPVIVLTSAGGVAQRTDCIAAGVDHVIDKPLNEHLMRSAVEAALRRRIGNVLDPQVDRMTGLPAAGEFRRRAAEVLNACEQADQPLSVGLMAVNGLEPLTLSDGGGATEHVLRTIGEALHSTSDTELVMAARWSAGEFVTLVRADSDKARVTMDAVVKRCAREIQGLDIRGWTGVINAAVHRLDAGAPLDEAIASADRLRRRAASQGQRAGMLEPRSGTPRVLICDDDEDTTTYLTELLDAARIETSVAANGVAALKRLAHESFDLLLLDWRMPEMQGDEVLTRIRAPDSPLRDLPIIMLTGVGDDTSITKAFALGVDDYLVKPCSERELVVRIRRALLRADQRVPPASYPPPRSTS